MNKKNITEILSCSLSDPSLSDIDFKINTTWPTKPTLDNRLRASIRFLLLRFSKTGSYEPQKCSQI